MTAISHFCGGDLNLDAAGGLATVSGADQAKQAIIRRLCTNAGDYIWQPDYGAGLPGKIGSPANLGEIQALVAEQMAQEASVDQTQPISITIENPSVGVYVCNIQYVDLETQSVQALEITN